MKQNAEKKTILRELSGCVIEKFIGFIEKFALSLAKN